MATETTKRHEVRTSTDDGGLTYRWRIVDTWQGETAHESTRRYPRQSTAIIAGRKAARRFD